MKITKNKLITEQETNKRELSFIFKIEFTNYLYETTDDEKSSVIAEFLRLKNEEFLNFIKSRIKVNENGLYFYDIGLEDKNIFISEIIATIANVTYNSSEIIVTGKGKFNIKGNPNEEILKLIEGNLEIAIDNNIKIEVPNNPGYKGTSYIKIRR